MRSEETEIIVLRVMDFSETSQILDAFSPEFGRLNLIAKGARKLIKNSLGSPFDTLCLAKINFIPKKTETLEIVKNNEITSYFVGLRKSLAVWFSGVLINEIVQNIVQPRNPEPEFFSSLKRVLNAIDKGADYRIALLYFFARVLRTLGVTPQVRQCAKSQLALSSAPYIAMTVYEPVSYLPKFAPADQPINLLSNRTFQIFAQFISGIKTPLNKVQLPDGVIIELSRFFKQLLENALERKIRCYDKVFW